MTCLYQSEIFCTKITYRQAQSTLALAMKVLERFAHACKAAKSRVKIKGAKLFFCISLSAPQVHSIHNRGLGAIKLGPQG
jgi:hypothetical protein